jgi:hypothetical protein
MPKKIQDSRSLKDFRNQFDREGQVRKRLKDALAALLKRGKEEWRSERELINMAGVSTKDIPQFRGEFAQHTVTVPSANRGVEKTIWFADPKVAAQVRPQFEYKVGK